MTAMLADPVCLRLRAAFHAAGYTVDGVTEALGALGHAALARNATVPGVRALEGRDDPLATLTRLWPLQQPVALDAVERALPGLARPLVGSGVLAEVHGRVTALVDIRPYAADDEPLWVISDLTPCLDTATSPIRSDFVLGVSSASSTLAQMTVRTPGVRALDLGTGCGVQALHLARHAREIVATDVNPRALELARDTLALNGVSADLRSGSLYEPVAGERFDLVVTNPPYVMSPPVRAAQRLTYREGGWTADAMVEHLVRHSPDVLAEGGTVQILANWAHLELCDWAERLREWIEPTGCDAHVVQREVMDPAAYVELWLADAGLAGAPDYVRRYGAWLDYFDELGVEAVGLGWIVLQRAGREQPSVRIEDWPHPVEQPIAATLRVGSERVEASRRCEGDLLAGRWRVADDIIEERVGRPGAADPEHIVLRQQRGFRRAVAANTALAGVVGACDGELELGRIIAAVAGLLHVDPAALTAELMPQVRQLLLDGLLRPAASRDREPT